MILRNKINRHPKLFSVLIIVFMYLIICCLFETITYCTDPSQTIHIIDQGHYRVIITIKYTDGSSQEITVSNTTVIKPRKLVSEIIYVYQEKECLGCSSSVKITHNKWIWLYVFPPNIGGLLHFARSYSVFQQEWKDPPFGLAIMVGTEDAYVEESLAGKIFLAYYGLDIVMNSANDILDKMNITDEHTRMEIASTALWAAQLVREAREQSPSFIVNARGLDHIISIHAGFLLHPLQLLGINLVRFIDKDDMYIAILKGLKTVEKYLEVFPEWKKVDEKNWLELCRRMENLTVEPVVPSYAHTLVLGALLIGNPFYTVLALIITIVLFTIPVFCLYRIFLKRLNITFESIS